MKKLFLLLILATLLVSCKNPVQDDVENNPTTNTETTDPVTPDPVIPANPWAEAVCDETDTDCSVSYIYVPKGWNPVDFNKDVYEQFSGRTEEDFNFLNFEKVGTLAFNSTDEDVIKADSTYIFSKRIDYLWAEPDEYYTEIDCYKVSVKKDFDLDYICMVYDDLNCYNHIMNDWQKWTGYTLEKSENGTWYLYTCIYDTYFDTVILRSKALAKCPKQAISNYN